MTDEDQLELPLENPQMAGHRELTTAEIALVNEINHMGTAVHGMLDALAKVENIDQRWLSIAVTDLQKGFMAAERAVTRPSKF